jgi:hypothetical protein
VSVIDVLLNDVAYGQQTITILPHMLWTCLSLVSWELAVAAWRVTDRSSLGLNREKVHDADTAFLSSYRSLDHNTIKKLEPNFRRIKLRVFGLKDIE